jgi:hypothetical protein
MSILKLNSNEMVSAPGIFMWAKQLWATATNDKDRKTAIQILSSWDSGLTDEQLGHALAGQIKTEIKGETVLIHVGGK